MHANRRREKMSFCKSQLLNKYNDYFSSYQKEFSTQKFQVSYSSAQKSAQSYRVTISTGVKVMLEGNDYATVDTFFSFIATFLDREIGRGDNRTLTKVNAFCQTLSVKRCTQGRRRKKHSEEVAASEIF